MLLNSPKLFKTKLCKYHQERRCKNGVLCEYAHSDQEVRSMPDLKKTKLCARFVQGRCAAGMDCKYAHGDQELRATEDFYNTSLCSAWCTTGDCPRGPACRYAHGLEDLRAPGGGVPTPGAVAAAAAKLIGPPPGGLEAQLPSALPPTALPLPPSASWAGPLARATGVPCAETAWLGLAAGAGPLLQPNQQVLELLLAGPYLPEYFSSEDTLPYVPARAPPGLWRGPARPACAAAGHFAKEFWAPGACPARDGRVAHRHAEPARGRPGPPVLAWEVALDAAVAALAHTPAVAAATWPAEKDLWQTTLGATGGRSGWGCGTYAVSPRDPLGPWHVVPSTSWSIEKDFIDENTTEEGDSVSDGSSSIMLSSPPPCSLVTPQHVWVRQFSF